MLSPAYGVSVWTVGAAVQAPGWVISGTEASRVTMIVVLPPGLVTTW
ncbi:hypothetical protein [Streptomyces atratus]